jgi:16S rRNA (uracil1498-N3)-methyltransferase
MRFYTDKITATQATVYGQEHTHLCRVMRCKAGDSVTLWCGDGADYQARIASTTSDSTTLQILSKSRNLAEPAWHSTLYVGTTRLADKLEYAVQKCVELGVGNIVPLITKHSVAKGVKVDRLSKIAYEAIKQCGRSTLVRVATPIKYQDMLAHLTQYSDVVFACERARSPFVRPHLGANSNIAIIVGSEGGFDEREIAHAHALGIKTVHLGPRILRTETAAVAIMSVLALGGLS